MSGGVTLSQVRGWDTGFLTAAAGRWAAAARSWEDTFSGLATGVGAAGWVGSAADAAQRRTHADRLTVIGLADRLHGAATIARDGALQIGDAQQAVLRVIHAAEVSGFVVQQDFSVTGAPVTVGTHRVRAEFFAAELRTAVGTLLSVDHAVAGRLTTATMGLGTSVFPQSGGWGAAEAPSAPPPRPGIQAVDDANRRLLDEAERQYRALPEGVVRSDRLADVAGIRAALTVPGAHLVLIDRPEEPAAMLGAAIAVGNPFTSDHCAVTVPAAGATTRGAIAGLTRDAAALRAEAARIVAASGSTETTAAVAYLGSRPSAAAQASTFLGSLGMREDEVVVIAPAGDAAGRSTRFGQAAALLGRPDLAGR